MNLNPSRWMNAAPKGFELIIPMEGEGKPRQGYLIVEAINWYSYVSNSPVKYVDPTGENSALVNFRNWAEGYGHSSVFVQDSNENWVAGDFGARKEHPTGFDLLKESWNGEATGGRFWKTNTGTSNLEEAIEIVASRLGGDSEFWAREFESTPEFDAKIFAAIDAQVANFPSNGEPAEGAERYKLVGNSCLDSSLEIFGEGNRKVRATGVIPNNVYDTWAAMAESLNSDSITIHRSNEE